MHYLVASSFTSCLPVLPSFHPLSPLLPRPRRYLQRLAGKVTQDLKLSNKATSQALEAVAKREQASASLGHLQPQYTLLVVRAKELQTQVMLLNKDDLSHYY